MTRGNALLQRWLLALTALLLGSGCAAYTTWRPAPEVPRVPSGWRGALDCAADALDCNVCAKDVRGQFASGDWETQEGGWTYDANQSHGGLTPRQAYNAFPKGHAQGFVRLSDAARYAMLHSYGRDGGKRVASLSVIDGSQLTRGKLTDLIALDAPDGHTSGAFSLGQFLGFIERDGVLILMNLASGDGEGATHRVQLPGGDYRDRGLSPRSGGVAMTKLQAGGYLLVANEGGSGASSGHSHFLRVREDLAAPTTSQPWRADYLGEFRYSTAAIGRNDYHHSENLSLITECESGDIYTVHVGSSGHRGMLRKLAVAESFWRVSQLVITDGVPPELQPVGVFTRRANLHRCWGRGAGSAHVTADGKIELLCHGRAVFPPAPWNYDRHVQVAE